MTAQDGASPLYVVCEGGHSDILDILVEAGADINEATNEVSVVTIVSIDGVFHLVLLLFSLNKIYIVTYFYFRYI